MKTSYSVEITDAYVNTRLVFSNNISKTEMLAKLAENDQNGLYLDDCNGDVRAAFAMLLSTKLYHVAKKLKVKSLVNITREFTKNFRNLGRIDLEDGCEYDFKLVAFNYLPQYKVEVA